MAPVDIPSSIVACPSIVPSSSIMTCPSSSIILFFSALTATIGAFATLVFFALTATTEPGLGMTAGRGWSARRTLFTMKSTEPGLGMTAKVGSPSSFSFSFSPSFSVSLGPSFIFFSALALSASPSTLSTLRDRDVRETPASFRLASSSAASSGVSRPSLIIEYTSVSRSSTATGSPSAYSIRYFSLHTIKM